jgi:hypothetical protein
LEKYIKFHIKNNKLIPKKGINESKQWCICHLIPLREGNSRGKFFTKGWETLSREGEKISGE